MIEHVDRPHRKPNVALGINVVQSYPPRFLDVAHVHVRVQDDDHFRQCHQTLTPQCIHHLVCLTGILLVDGDEDEVVKDPLRRHVVIHDLRYRQLEQRQEDSLRRVSEVVILHRRTADDRRRVDRIVTHRQRRYVHLRIKIGLRVKTRSSAGSM